MSLYVYVFFFLFAVVSFCRLDFIARREEQRDDHFETEVCCVISNWNEGERNDFQFKSLKILQKELLNVPRVLQELSAAFAAHVIKPQTWGNALSTSVRGCMYVCVCVCVCVQGDAYSFFSTSTRFFTLLLLLLLPWHAFLLPFILLSLRKKLRPSLEEKAANHPLHVLLLFP